MNQLTQLFLITTSSAFLAHAGSTAGEIPIETADPEDDPFINRLFSGLQRIDLDYDLLHSSDISVDRTSFIYRQEQAGWNLEASLGYTDFGIDYTDPVGETNAARRNEDSWSGGLTLGMDVSDSVSSTIGFSAYDGYADFQSVWISEYYDQSSGIPFPDSYEEASPGGWGLNAGIVWDYDPGVARLSADFGYSRDEIVPAWDVAITPEGFPVAQSSIDELDTYSGSVTWEMALNPRLRTQLNARFIDVTARDPRLQARNQWAWAITDKLTARTHLGFAVEDPDFEAYYGGIALQYDFSPQWSITLSGRLYHDTGEVVSAGFNTAAPELDSSEISATLGWSNSDTSVRLGIGLYETNYGDLDDDNQFFADLYDDRDFTLGRFAITHQF